MCNSIQERLGHLDIIDEVKPSEAHALHLPVVVGPLVDDGRYASHDPSVTVGEEVVGLTEGKSRVAILAERVHLVTVEVGYGKGTVAVEVVEEVDKGFQLGLALYLDDFDMVCY